MAELKVVPEHGSEPVIATEVRGHGQPPVVFIPGSGNTSESFAVVMDEIEAFTQVVGYARPGIGDTGPAPCTDPRGVAAAAVELRVALSRTEVSSPRILVGHSFGALIALAYVAAWPEEVAGVVLDDASDPQLFLDSGQSVIDDGDGPGSIPFDVVATVRDLEDVPLPLEVPVTVVASRPGRWLEISPEQAQRWEPHTLAQVDALWQDYQKNLAERLDADLVVAEVGGHYVHQDQPELVSAAIKQMLA